MQLLNNQPEASLSYVMMFLTNLGVDDFYDADLGYRWHAPLLQSAYSERGI